MHLRLGLRSRAVRIAFCIGVRPCQHEDRLAGGEIEAVAWTAREEAHVLVRLALIRLELKRQAAVALAQASVRGRRCWQRETEEKQEQQENAAKRDQRVLEHVYLPFMTS